MPDVVIQELAGGRGIFIAGTAFDLATVGYTQAEYGLSGAATSFARKGSGVASAGEADFKTRIVVYRPRDNSTFNGTVWVEWLNVSGGLDAAPGWIFTHTELIRSGAAWVGVSAQSTGVQGGASILGMPSTGLVGTDPERYGSLYHPGDRFSYDIFTIASEVVRQRAGTILDGLNVERVIATGDSQSAFRLTTYVNEIANDNFVHDGFMVHARGGSAAPLEDDGDLSSVLQGEPVFFRDDLRVPVLCVEAETDLINLGYLTARQDDAEGLVVWEIAGASHADVYTFKAGHIDTGSLPIEVLAQAWLPFSEVFGMKVDKLVNAGPQHYVRNAAAASLDRWVRGGERPSSSPRLEVSDGSFVMDSHGNVRGGIRTPHVDVPTAVLSGLGNSGHSISFLCGSTVPFDAAELSAMYEGPNDYNDRFEATTRSAVHSGFVLADDEAEIVEIARINSPV